MNYRIKSIGNQTLTISALMLAGILNAQTAKEGFVYLDNDQYIQAKKVFDNLLVESLTANNYFYLGNYYLEASNPNIEVAKQNFDRGLAVDPKSNLNRIGLATIKLYKGDKLGANADFLAIASSTRYKDEEVLYYIAKAYILFPTVEKATDPAKSIEYFDRLFERVGEKKDNASYNLALGDAYSLLKTSEGLGKAIKCYERAIVLGNSSEQAMAYAKIANVRGRTLSRDSYNLSMENFDKAIAANANTPLIYKLRLELFILYEEYDKANQDLEKYLQLTNNNDAQSQIFKARLAYLSKNYDKALAILDKDWDLIDDPSKYKLKALLLTEKSDAATAYSNMQQYLEKTPSNEVLAEDYGIIGKIQAMLIPTTPEGEQKKQLIEQAIKNMTEAVGKGDTTYNYATLLAEVYANDSSIKYTEKTNSTIEALKKTLEANPRDTQSWYSLAWEQYDVEDYIGSVGSWNKLISIIPDWAPAYIGKGRALYSINPKSPSEETVATFQKYIDIITAKKEALAEGEKSNLVFSYSFFAYKYFNEGDLAKAQEYIEKVQAIDPNDENILNLLEDLK